MATPITKNMTQNGACISDQELYSLAKLYGTNALMWRQKFIGLLPEVNRRRLYEKKGFSSIFEFAFKLAGLSAEQVKLALNLDVRFTDKPALKCLLEDGSVSINKLARVVSIATEDNQDELANIVKVLPKSALETLVRDEKLLRAVDGGIVGGLQNPNGLFKPQNEVKSLPGQTCEPAKTVLDELGLNQEVSARLMELKNKGMDLNQVLMELLDKREEEIQEEKAKIAEEIKNCARNKSEHGIGHEAGVLTKPSRYIPSSIRKILKKEHGTKCSITGCTRPAEEIHHTQIFALGHNHNPQFLAPLCKNHHKIAHSINLKIQEKRLVT